MKQSSEMTEVYYRYEDFLESDEIDESGESYGSHVALRLRKFNVIKHTPKGVRLDTGKVVIHSHTKQYACRSIEEARISFLKRKERQISIYQIRIKNAQKAIELLELNRRTRWGSPLETPKKDD